LTPILIFIGESPSFCHSFPCRQASLNTQSPIGTINPASSAMGINSSGKEIVSTNVNRVSI